jgi:hypothetical protein
MKFPTLIILCVFFFLVSAYAECEIDGSWTKNEYDAGNTMKFEGEISPSSGFIEIELLNDNNDKVAKVEERQITDDFEFEFDTDNSYLNGDYKIKVYYTKYANGTDCDETLTSTAKLNTSNKIGDIGLNVTIVQSPGTNTESVDGSPVETAWGEITSKIDVTGPKGWASSFNIDGTQLAPGSSLGTVDLHLTQCQKNEDILTSYKTISDFLNSDYDDVLTLTQEKATLAERIEGYEDQIWGVDGNGGLNGEIRNLTRQVSSWKTTAESKWDFPPPFIIGTLSGILIIISLRKYMLAMASKEEPPNQGTEENEQDIIVHE